LILEKRVLDALKIDQALNQRLSKAIADALDLTGVFHVNPYSWDFKPEE